MERLSERQRRILTYLDKKRRDKEDFKKDLEEFISYWEKEAEELKNRELTENDGRNIKHNFDFAMERLCFDWHSKPISISEHRRLNLIESKLDNSLAIARSNYRSKHKNIWERLVDNIGGIFHIFGKGN